MEKKFEQEDTVSMSNAVIPSKKYLISGFELDLDSLTIYIDQAIDLVRNSSIECCIIAAFFLYIFLSNFYDSFSFR